MIGNKSNFLGVMAKFLKYFFHWSAIAFVIAHVNRKQNGTIWFG